MTDPIRAALERLIARLHETTDLNEPVPAWSDSFYAARAALSADGPAVPEGREPAAVVGEPSDEELLGLDQLAAAWNAQADAANGWDELGLDEIIVWAQRQALARWGRQPTPPAEGEVGELVAWLRCHSSLPETRRAAALLEQRHPAPVPVSERPWERDGWCDEAGRCWFGAPQDGAADAGWILRKPSERLSHQTVSLPAHALPVPAGEVGP
jgi:hypothetical protein